MPRIWSALLALTCVLLLTTSAQASVSRTEAARKAIAALGVNDRTGAEIVFAGTTTVPSGTTVRELGFDRPGKQADNDKVTNGVTRSRAPILAEAKGTSWVFYNDRGPRAGSGRSGRVAIVRVSNGAVTLTPALQWLPTVGGVLPLYLRSPVLYEADTYRVFQRAASTRATTRANAADLIGNPNVDTSVAAGLGGARTCGVRIGDTLGKSAFDVDGVGPATELIDRLFLRLDATDPRIAYETYRVSANRTPASWLEAVVSSCSDVLLWIGGGTFPGDEDAVAVGLRPDGAFVEHQSLSLAALRKALAARPTTRFTVVLDVPRASTFASLGDLPNVYLPKLPSRAGTPGSRDAKSPYTLRVTRALYDGMVRVLREKTVLTGAKNTKECLFGLALLVTRSLDPTACPAPSTAASGSSGPVLPQPQGPVLLADTTDLSVGVSTQPARPKKGDTVQVTVSITNAGRAQAEGVRVRTVLPSALAPTSASSVATLVGQRIDWEAGTIPSGSVRVQTITATAASGVVGDIVSEVLAATPQDIDSTPGNGAVEDDLARRTVDPVAADVNLFYRVTTFPTVGVGDTATFVIELNNDGPDPASKVKTQVRLSSAWNFLDVTSSLGVAGTLDQFPPVANWTVNELAPGETEYLTVQARSNTITSSATVEAEIVAADSFDRDAVPGNGLIGEDDEATGSWSITP